MHNILLQSIALHDSLLPPFGGSPLRGGTSSSPLRGGRGPPPPFLGGGEGGSSQREEPAGARHAWLAWPWASQAITHERFRVPTVLATRVPWACEWAVGCARGRRALAHRSVERASVFIGCVGHLLSLTAGGEDPTHVLGRGWPQHTPFRGLTKVERHLPGRGWGTGVEPKRRNVKGHS